METTTADANEYDDEYFDAASDGFYSTDIDGGYEDYEPSPYDGTYSEE